MTNPTRKRVAELLEIVTEGLRDGRDNLQDYDCWDDLIECDEVMTFEEWDWCRDHMEVEMTVSVSIKGTTP